MDLPFDPAKVRIGTTGDIAPAAREVARCALDLARLQVAPCANLASSRPMTDANGEVLAQSVFGWPDSEDCWWRDRSIALRSLLPQISRLESEPVWANARGIYRADGPVPVPPGVDLAMMDGCRVVRAAIVVPVHLPFSQVGVVTFSCIDRQRDGLGGELREHGPVLHLLATTFISSYVRVVSRRPAAEATLTPRETECLRWAAIGKTDREIAELISRKHGTVRYHLHNCSEKLHAVTRTQTVFKAAQLGYLASG